MESAEKKTSSIPRSLINSFLVLILIQNVKTTNYFRQETWRVPKGERGASNKKLKNSETILKNISNYTKVQRNALKLYKTFFHNYNKWTKKVVSPLDMD